MDIVIVGDGKVGATLTEMLSGEGHSLTIIDQNPAVLKRQTERLDIIGVLGNGASYQVQQEAGVPDADLFIAATSTDEVNMVCCLLAKKLGCPNTIARIRNPEYNEQLRLMREELGLSLVINPELSAAREIASLLSFPHADSIGSLSGGRVQIVRYTLEEKGLLIGRRLSEISQKRGQNVVVCAVEREGEVSIPKGEFRLEAGDHIYLAGKLSNIDNFLRAYGERSYAIRNAMVIGGGKITHYLAKMLEGTATKLKILEKDPQRCRLLAEKLPHALVIEADGSDRAVLDEEGIGETDAVIALTNMDEENLIISMYGIRCV